MSMRTLILCLVLPPRLSLLFLFSGLASTLVTSGLVPTIFFAASFVTMIFWVAVLLLIRD